MFSCNQSLLLFASELNCELNLSTATIHLCSLGVLITVLNH